MNVTGAQTTQTVNCRERTTMCIRKFILSAAIFVSVQAQAATFNIRDYGAKADKKTNDASAIQKAIDKCSETGGGTVYCPSGDYLSGVIQLKSNVTLYLEQGATIWQSPEPNDFIEVKTDGALEGDFNAQLIIAHNQENISILGQGTIRGQGEADLDRRASSSARDVPKFRIGIFLFEECNNVAIRDIKILYSDTWTVHLKRCKRVFIDGVTILNNFYRTNADGIDVHSCRDVHISNCNITAGDDCICLKTTKGNPCENIVVTNCTLETVATAIKFGTASQGDFRDIRISNCTIRNSTVGIGIFVKDGGTVERVAFENISIETLKEPTLVHDWLRNMIYPVFVDIEKREDGSPAGAVRDITFRDIDIYSDNGILIQGMPESEIENATFENITIRVDKSFDYSQRTKHTGGKSNPKDARRTIYARKPSYFTLAHIKGLALDNIRVFVKDDVIAKYPRSALSLNECASGIIRSVFRTADADDKAEPVVTMHNCRDMLLTNNLAPLGTRVFLGLTGNKTAHISLAANDLTNAENKVTQSKDVPKAALKK